MLFNGGFAAPAADAAGTDEFGILVNCAVRRFGHDRVFSRIKNPCQATLHFFDHVHLSCPGPRGFADASTPWFFSSRRPDATRTHKPRVHVVMASRNDGVDREHDLIREFLQNTSIPSRKLILSRA